VPAPVLFDTATPSPDPANPSCAIEYECYEGMLVQMDGTVTGPNQGFGSDPIAEFHITAGAERTYREPGLEFPGMVGIPVWDGNPEVFELDADKLGLPNVLVTPGTTFSATGIIGYEFSGYELWASSLTVTVAPIAGGVRDAEATESTVGSLNLFRLFDDIDDPAGMNVFGETTNDTVVASDEYQRRLIKLARFIVERMKSPDVIGVQEVESLKVLEDLAAAVDDSSPGTGYQAYLVEGNDIGGIDVGFLVREGRVDVSGVVQMGADETYINPEDGVLDILHDRPPLVLDATFGPSSFPMNVMVVHNRSLGGIETERVQVKRFEQAQSIARMLQDLQDDVDSENVVVVGDFNAFEFSDGYVDTVGHIRGVFDPTASLLSGADLVDPDFMNQVFSMSEGERYSFIFRGNSQVLDHALTSMTLDLRVRGMQYARGNADAAADLINDGATPLRASDHDGFVLYIDTPAMKCDIDGDGNIDISDIRSISGMRGSSVPPANPAADLDDNGIINVLDARGCVRQCSLLRCATP
jgi:predicted extracellular nuclease